MRAGFSTIVRARRQAANLGLHAIGMVDHRLYMRGFLSVMRGRGMDIEGTPRYVSPRAIIDGTDFSLIHLGDGSVISSGVRVLTHDFSIDRVAREDDANGDELVLTAPVWVGRRCFVGAASILMPGCRLGDGVIVGAGSVVRGEVQAGSIVIGNPATMVSHVDDFHRKNIARAHVN